MNSMTIIMSLTQLYEFYNNNNEFYLQLQINLTSLPFSLHELQYNTWPLLLCSEMMKKIITNGNLNKYTDVCRRAHALFTLFVLVCIQWCPTHIVYPMLPVSLDCPFLIAPSVFSNVYLQFPWIVHFLLPLRYSLMFIYTNQKGNMRL